MPEMKELHCLIVVRTADGAVRGQNRWRVRQTVLQLDVALSPVPPLLRPQTAGGSISAGVRIAAEPPRPIIMIAVHCAPGCFLASSAVSSNAEVNQ